MKLYALIIAAILYTPQFAQEVSFEMLNKAANVNSARNTRKPMHPLLRLTNAREAAGKAVAQE